MAYQKYLRLYGSCPKGSKSSQSGHFFGTYTGAWYPSYYEVGVNFASNQYDPSKDFDWATRNTKTMDMQN